MPSPHSTIKLNFHNLINLNIKLPEIDFYFSSLGEIPCKKEDNSISDLFTYLDLTTIIKILFKLLTENSTLFFSNDASILTSIIPGMLKLFFPLEYIFNVLPVIPKKKEEILIEIPSVIFAGIVGDNYNNKVIEKIKNENIFLVNCNTNEIINNKEYGNFVPLPGSALKKEDTVLKYNKLNNSLYEFEIKSNSIRPIIFLRNGEIIIDCNDNNKLKIEVPELTLSDKEKVEFRTKIQEIKGLNLGKKKYFLFNRNNLKEKNKENHFIRSYSYQINKIFSEMIYRKINDKYDPLYIETKKTNMIKSYEGQKKLKYQNDSNYSIYQNILYLDKINEVRCYENSFFIVYNLFNFSDNFINLFKENEKIKEWFNDYKFILEHIKDYFNEDKISDFKFFGENGFIKFSKYFIEEINKIKNNQTDEIFLQNGLSNQFYDEIIKNIFVNPKNNNNFINNENININNSINYSKNNKYKEKEKIEFYKMEIDGKKNFDKENFTQYYLYCAKVLIEMEKNNIFSEYINLKNLNVHILNCFSKAYKCEEKKCNDNKIIDFPFITFYSFLNNIKNNELLEIEKLNHLLVDDLLLIYKKVKMEKKLYVFNYK